MNVKTEPVVFLLFAAWAGMNLTGGDEASVTVRGGNRSAERPYTPLPAPDPTIALPEAGRDDFFGRDLFAPPSDTAPLPPLELQLPPMEALQALLPPSAYGPGPSMAHLLSVAPQVRLVPGLFTLAPEGPAEPESVLQPTDPSSMTADERSARLEAFKRQYDWIVIDSGRLMFGQIRNKRRFELSGVPEPVQFVEIDPETGLERFPGQQAISYERPRVLEFGLANTPVNEIELGLRSFTTPLRHGDMERGREFAARCIELRNETPRGLEVAEQMYRLLSEADSTDVRGPLGLARCYELGFRFEEAFAAYTDMTQSRFKTEAAPWARLGDLLARFRLFDRAEEAYGEALRVRAAHWETRLRFGRFLADRGRFEEALVHLTEAARREPTDSELRWARVEIRAELGACLFQLGRIEDAYERFEQARNANPSVDLGLAGMVSAALFLDDVEAPLVDAEGDEGPDASFDLLLALGLASLHEGEWVDARGFLERAAEADPFRAWLAHRALSWLAEVTGHPEEAYSFIERAYLAAPTDPWTLYQLGRLLAARGDNLGARQAFKAALDRDLDFADALIGLGHLHQLAGEHGPAERYYQRALTVDSDRPIVHSLRGFNHFRLGEPGAAGDDFDLAVAGDTSLASARNGQAWWYYATGDSEEAKTRFDYVVEARREAEENDPHRKYAIDQRQRIMEHEAKEVWTDRFDRDGAIKNGWELDEGAGVVSSLRDGEVWLDGRFENSGVGRIYQVLPAERFLSIECTVTLHDVKDVNVGVFVSKEQPTRTGEARVQSKVALRRSREGKVQATLIRRGQHEEEVVELLDHSWSVGQPVRVRVETNGDSSDQRMTLWLDDLPVLENFEVQSLGRSQMPVRFGVAVEGDLGRAATISVDDVNVVRRN